MSDERYEGEIEIRGDDYRVCVAWRGDETGYGVLYSYPTNPDMSDRSDRRALLSPDADPWTLAPSGLREAWEAGRQLTETERRFLAPDGCQWLAQSRGPVWAEPGSGEGRSGIVFTSLEGAWEQVTGPGGHVGSLSEEELAGLWRVRLGTDAKGHGTPPDDSASA